MINVYLFLIWTASFVSSARQLNETCWDAIEPLKCNESLLCTTFRYLDKPNPHEIHLCSIPWKDDLDEYVKLFTDEYTSSFLDKIEDDFSYNFQEYGDTILQGTTAVDENTGEEIIPSDEPQRKAAINNYLKENFADSLIEKFPAITKEAITFAMGSFIVETQKKGEVTQAQVDAYKTDMFKKMEEKSKYMLNVYVNLVWKEYMDEQIIQVDEMSE
jgi:hypothetical protein